jgi:hypothetical protein
MLVTATPEAEAFLASTAFEAALANDDGQAAKQHLAAGRPIYYGDARYPGQVMKEFPDGRKQLVAVSDKGEISVIRDL